jgi:hypothetical protein
MAAHDVPISPDQHILLQGQTDIGCTHGTRADTEGMYGGVEFFPLPEAVYTALCANPKMKPWKDKAGLENIALSTRIVSVQGCTIA